MSSMELLNKGQVPGASTMDPWPAADCNPGTGEGLVAWEGEAFEVGALVNDLMLRKKAGNVN